MLGDVIRARRQQLGMKQATLAQKVGTGQSYISEIEQGIRTNLTTDLLQRLAIALGVPLDELIKSGRADMPAEVAALHAAGVPDAHLQEIAEMWADMTEQERDLTLTITRSVWERRQRREQVEINKKDNHPSPAD